MKTKFNYVVLRYVHDVISGEFVNFGIVMVAPDVFFAKAICTPKYLISRFFQGVFGKHFNDVNERSSNQDRSTRWTPVCADFSNGLSRHSGVINCGGFA